jgi:hypothetical protein
MTVSERREYTTERRQGPAEVWQAGRCVATGYLNAQIERETLVFWDGERVAGRVDFRGQLSELTGPLARDGAFEIHWEGRTIPCSIDGVNVHPSGSISPPL